MYNFWQHHLLLFAIAARIALRLLLVPICHILYHKIVHFASHGVTHRLSHTNKVFRFIPDAIMVASLVVYDFLTEKHSETES